MLRSSLCLCDYSDTYVLVKETLTVTNKTVRGQLIIAQIKR